MNLTREVADKDPAMSFGFEVVRGLNAEIRGEENIKEARRSLASLSKIASEQTDYTVEVFGGNVLVRPKQMDEIFGLPLSKTIVQFSVSPEKWDSLSAAVENIRVAATGQKLNGGVSSIQDALPKDAKINLGDEKNRAVLEEMVSNAAAKKLDAAEALFGITRIVGARSWICSNYESFVDGKRPQDRPPLVGANICFYR